MIQANSIIGGRYRVTRPLGGGGMKLVYLAEDLRLAARPCALAEMVDSFSNPDTQHQAVTAFQREADMLAQLSNEHIPRIFDRFSDANRHYLVMEYVDGVTLEEAQAQAGGRLTPERMVDIALQILDTLEYLHNLEPSVIYRDLKPSNVMLTGKGQVKLIDFGIARFFQPQSAATMIGTQGYAPPEQYRGRAEARSDLYAMGATMHHALSGRDPSSEAPFSFPPIRSLCPGIDPELADLIDQSLQYDVIRRMVDATEFKTRLLAIKARLAQGNGGGLPAKPQAASGKPQLQLPLSQRGPQSSQPTILVNSDEMECAVCRRSIPTDSRFCSFCGVDVTQSIDGNGSGVSPDAATVVLSNPTPARGAGAATGASEGGYHVWRDKRRNHGLKYLAFMLIAIFAIAFGVTAILSYRGQQRISQPVSPPVVPGYAPPGVSSYGSASATALRLALNAAGYNGVRFQIRGDTVILWGSVPDYSAIDNIQLIIFTVVPNVSSIDETRLVVHR